MNALATSSAAESGPAVHLEFIQNQADLPEAEGLEAVDSYHRAVFLHHHARDFERFRQEARIHEDRVRHLETRLAGLDTRLTGQDKLLPVQLEGAADLLPNAPWNHWDRAMFAASLLGVLALLVFGVLNISFNLLESGLVTFVENPVRAYFWAALLPAGALAVKIGWDSLQSRAWRNAYLWACLVLGMLGVLVWIGAYASVYPTLSKTTAEQIESLSVFGNSAAPSGASNVKWTDLLIVSSQAAAEIFLSAALGIYLTILYSRHRPVRLAENPVFIQFDGERRQVEEAIARERIALAEAQGGEARLQHQLAALVAFARSLFQRESALRRDQLHQKRQVLDQISEQLRSQLQSMPNNLPGLERNGALNLGGRDLPNHGK